MNRSNRTNRPVVLLTAVLFLFSAVFYRLTAVSERYSYPASGNRQGERTAVISKSRGYIYDRNGVALVNTAHENMVIRITDVSEETGSGVTAAGNLQIRRTREKVAETNTCKNVATVKRYEGNPLCAHVIGYLDAQGQGVCGVERSFDRLLHEAEGTLSVRFSVNGLGHAIAGRGLQIRSDAYDNPAGVMLTIDAEVQRIAEAAIRRSSIETGAAVVLDVETAEILAMVSVPVFDVNELSASLHDERSPFLNRAVSAWPVGSVFKPIVAAAAASKGVGPDIPYTCEGGVDCGGMHFSCYRGVSHGETDLQHAICKSCNSYFIHLASLIGPQALVDKAKEFGFGKEIRLTGDIVNAAGVVPAAAALDSSAALANLSFGQGELLASPLQLAAAYAALANGGTYREPVLMKYLIDQEGEKYAYYLNEVEYPVLDGRTCEALGKALALNMLEGTGTAGRSDLVSSAGKTATAQTGRYPDGDTEQLCTWFCGWAPYESPRCAIVIFNENGSAASVDCAPVFRDIIEGLYDAEMFE